MQTFKITCPCHFGLESVLKTIWYFFINGIPKVQYSFKLFSSNIELAILKLTKKNILSFILPDLQFVLLDLIKNPNQEKVVEFFERLVPQCFQLLLALMLGDLRPAFFLQTAHFSTLFALRWTKNYSNCSIIYRTLWKSPSFFEKKPFFFAAVCPNGKKSGKKNTNGRCKRKKVCYIKGMWCQCSSVGRAIHS